MRRLLLVVMACTLIGALILLPNQMVRASTFTVTFDEGGHAYTIVTGALATGGDYGGYYLRSQQTPSSEDCSSTTFFEVTIPVNTWDTVSRIDAGFLLDGSSTAYYFDPIFRLYNGGTQVAESVPHLGPLNHWNSYFVEPTSFTGGDSLYIYWGMCWLPETVRVGIDVIQVTYTETETPTPTPTATLDPTQQGWNKPLRAADVRIADTSYHGIQNPFAGVGLLPWSSAQHNEDTAFGFSELAFAPVFAVRDGTIDSVELLTNISGNACTSSQGTGPYCLAVIYGDVSYYWTRYEDTYVITESIEGGRKVRYFVQGPQVAAGDTVTAGCQIGKTLPMKGYLENDWPIGAVLVQGIEPDGISAFDITQKFVYPPLGNRCASTRGAACTLVQNPDFQISEGGWTVSPGYPELPSVVPYIVPEGGIIFPVSVEQTLSLDSAAQYKIGLSYAVQPGATDQTFSVTLGTTVQTITAEAGLSGALVEKTFDAASYTADQDGGLYTLRVTALTGQADLTELRFICVSDADDQVVTPGGGCIVLDPNFNQAWTASPWTVSEEPPAVVPGGMAVVPDDASISQQITLNPADGGANENYDLQVTYRRQGIASEGDDISLDWSFGGQSGNLLPASTSQTWADYSATFGIADDPVTDWLILTGVGSDSAQSAQVSRVCIVPHDGGTPPGYRPAPPFEPGCKYCVYSPTGDLPTDFSEFVQWLACQFYQLWECQAKILLRYIWQVLSNILTLLGFLRLWLSATISGIVSWGSGNLVVFVRWLGGTIHNAVQDVVWAILNWHGSSGGGGASLWDVLIALVNGLFALLTTFVQLVAQIIQLIISGLIGLLVNGAGLILGLLQSIINGLNAGATSIDTSWLPNCADPNSNLFVVCTAISGIESGLAVGPFALIVPLGLGLAALNLIFWGIRRVLSVFSQ